MDAAALAGAGLLAFSDSAFPGVRAEARRSAGLNPYRGGVIDLTGPGGQIVLGVWDPAASPRFQPSTDGHRVNAVLCRYRTTIPTTLLNVLGRRTLPVGADAIAVANPPGSAPGCLFPLGVSPCPFVAGGAYGTQGCGQPVATVSPGTVNTAAWVNLEGSRPRRPRRRPRDPIPDPGPPAPRATRVRLVERGRAAASAPRAGERVTGR